MKELLRALSEKCKNKTTLAIILITGMILMLASGELFEGGSKEYNEESFSHDEYRQEIEQSLTDILSEMKGVDNVHVMVTLEKQSSTPFGSVDAFMKSSTENTSLPRVSGAVIAAKGASDSKTLEKIYYAAKAALNISGSRIAVIEAK